VSRARAGFFVAFLALAAYANALGNGFAYDDDGIITQNPVVQSGDWERALTGSWWPDPLEGAGLYRPLTLTSFVGEWKLFGGEPLGFHTLNAVFHALVSLLAFVLLLSLGSLPGAAAGAVVFAVHPLHTEAVANVVGRAELYAALFYLGACLLYWKGRRWTGVPRYLRLVGLGLLFLLALMGKEIAVTLPGALFLLELFASLSGQEGTGAPHEAGESRARGLQNRLWGETPVFLLLAVVLAAYLGLRYLALGTVMGEIPAPIFLAIGPTARVLTALAIWVQYVRLLLFPLDLAVDYDPGVLFPSEGLDLPLLMGILTIVLLGLAAYRTRKALPLVSFGILWFAVAVFPVSNLIFPTGVILAERTLYLPSLGLAFAVAGLVPAALSLPRTRQLVLLAAGVAFVGGLFIKTVLRNPSWMSSFIVQQTLHEEHPESWRAIRARAQGLERVGEIETAREDWDLAVRLAPMNYTLLVQAGDFHCRQGLWERCEANLRKAISLGPNFRNAYQLLSGHMIRRDFGREGHRIALEGLARSRNDQELWALVSESYILKGDLPAAARAREAAIALDPDSGYQWGRLADILEGLGQEEGAARARSMADSLPGAGQGEGPA
jgi:tetratricopeptide (TPR) repeat protein